jgi:class I fructose-bisphosphate aldolase
MLGKLVRMNRLRNPVSGRIFTVALDHAPSYGVLSGLENIASVLERVADGKPDAIMLMKGPAKECYAPCAGEIPLILKCSTLSVWHPEHDVWVNSVEDALRLGADAIAMAVTIGSDEQPEILKNLAQLVREAECVGLPVIAHAYPNGARVPNDERYSAAQVSYAARLAMEVGVDIVKTFYTGSRHSFAEVVQAAAPACVVAAGGPRLHTVDDAFHMAHEVVLAQATGITFGRNVWQSGDISNMIRALNCIIHHEGTPIEAREIYATGAHDGPM